MPGLAWGSSPPIPAGFAVTSWGVLMTYLLCVHVSATTLELNVTKQEDGQD